MLSNVEFNLWPASSVAPKLGSLVQRSVGDGNLVSGHNDILFSFVFSVDSLTSPMEKEINSKALIRGKKNKVLFSFLYIFGVPPTVISKIYVLEGMKPLYSY